MTVDRDLFLRTYRRAVDDVIPFVTPKRQELLGRHNAGLHPAHSDLRVYLQASERRYVRIIDQFNSQRPGTTAAQVSVLDIGGFLGAFPLALARCGLDVTLAEEYDYYYGAFDDLKQFLEREGVGVWAADFTQPLVNAPAQRYSWITNLAMIEHLPSSPKALFENMQALIAADGLLFVDVPNIAYWPNRLRAMRGKSIHQPLEFMYESVPPFMGHHREYTAEELVELLNWSGFEVLATEVFNYTPTPNEERMRDRLLRLTLETLPMRFIHDSREIILAVGTPSTQGKGSGGPPHG